MLAYCAPAAEEPTLTAPSVVVFVKVSVAETRISFREPFLPFGQEMTIASPPAPKLIAPKE